MTRQQLVDSMAAYQRSELWALHIPLTDPAYDDDGQATGSKAVSHQDQDTTFRIRPESAQAEPQRPSDARLDIDERQRRIETYRSQHDAGQDIDYLPWREPQHDQRKDNFDSILSNFDVALMDSDFDIHDIEAIERSHGPEMALNTADIDDIF